MYVVPFPGPGGKWQVSQGGAVEAKWTKGGREIIYVSNTGVFAVEVSMRGPSMKIGTPKLLFHDPLIAGGDITNDGERFLVARRPSTPPEEPVTLLTNWTALLKK